MIDKDKAVEAQHALERADIDACTEREQKLIDRYLLDADQLRELIEERYTLSSAVDMYKGKLQIVEAELDRYKADTDKSRELLLRAAKHIVLWWRHEADTTRPHEGSAPPAGSAQLIEDIETFFSGPQRGMK